MQMHSTVTGVRDCPVHNPTFCNGDGKSVAGLAWGAIHRSQQQNQPRALQQAKLPDAMQPDGLRAHSETDCPMPQGVTNKPFNFLFPAQRWRDL